MNADVAGDQLVLVVDDEELVADLMQTALEDGGFAVRVAKSYDAAQSVLDDDGLTIIAVVTDVNLARPGAGWDLARHARERNSGVPVVYVSGDSEHEWAAQGVPGSSFLSKPFAPVQLVVAVATLINGPTAA